MSATNWVLIYAGDVIFWAWIFYLGGADILGDTPISGIFTFVITLKWRELSPEALKLWGVLLLTVHTFFFILGLIYPAVRSIFGL